MTEQYVCGLHAVSALLNNRHRKTQKIYINESSNNPRLQDLEQLAATRGIAVDKTSIQKMNQQFSQYTHQGVVAIAETLREHNERDLVNLLQGMEKNAAILILDGLTDPHNLGACLRTADAVAVDFVIIPKDNSASITPAVTKTASGAAETIPLVRVSNLARAMDIIKAEGIWVYGAAGEAKSSLYQMDLTSPVALAFGAEGKGLRRLTRDYCDSLFSLPMLGAVESLNVSVAAGVAMYEMLRQRL